MLVTALWQLVVIMVVSAVAGWLIGRSPVVRPRVVLLCLIASITFATTLGGIARAAEPQSLARGRLQLDSVELLPIFVAAFTAVVVGAVVGYAVAPRRDGAGS